MLSKADPDFEKKSDIKWNFTKFLIDREGANRRPQGGGGGDKETPVGG